MVVWRVWYLEKNSTRISTRVSSERILSPKTMRSNTEYHKYISRDDISACIDRLASEIHKDYHDRHPLVLGILVGSFVFMADLIRKLDFPLDVDFARLNSYGSGTESSKKVSMMWEPSTQIQGRDVLLVDDIADTGYSLSFIMSYIKKQNPRSVKLCVLADKPSRREVPVDIDYKGFTVGDGFLVGYGLDFDSKHRNLPDIRVLGDVE